MKESQKLKVKSQKLRTFMASFSLLLVTASTAFAQKGIEESLSEVKRLIPSKEVVPTPWGRDPFIPVTGVKEGIKRRDLRLSAIIYSEKRPSAIIDNKIVYIGDIIDGQKIVDIKQEYVILQTGNRPYRLELESSPSRHIPVKEAP